MQPVPPKKTLSQAVRAVNKPARNLTKAHRDEANFMNKVYSAIKDQKFIKCLRPLPSNPKGPGARKYCAFHDGMGHRTVNCRSLQRQLQELVNQGYLQEFVLNPEQPSETKVKKTAHEVPQQESQAIQYREINTIFGASPIEGWHRLPRKGNLHQ